MLRFLLFLVAILAGSLAALSLLGFGKAPEPDRAKPLHDWVLIYYMSYDNNLDHCGPAILDALEKGVSDSELVVTVLSDDTDQSGVKRHTITSRGRTVETLETDNSASEQLVSEYLAWVAKTFPARHYAIVFLNHGGRLDQMCLDERTGENNGNRWLSARLVGPIIREFRDKTPGEVDLLFLQQCGRGSLENLYNFRKAAATIMASQTNVGAPNTYYEETLKWLANETNGRSADRVPPSSDQPSQDDGKGLGRDSSPTGLELAQQIISSDEHFAIFACVDGKAVAEIPARINPVIEALIGNHNLTLKTAGGPLPCHVHESETCYDAIGWLEHVFRENNRSTEELDQFEKWMREELIVAKAAHPRLRETLAGWCGLSLSVPVSEDVRGKYPDYPIYQDSRLDDLWRVAYPKFDAKRKGRR